MKAVHIPGGDDGPAGASALRVGGLIRFSNADWPGKLAAVLFLQGCPWHCGYCQNPHLLPPHGAHEEDWPATLAWLATRRGLLDAVVFSGGEPTAQAELPAAIRAVRALGFALGLHTGGAYPRRLLEVARDVDWVGLDIKAPIARLRSRDRRAAQRVGRVREPRPHVEDGRRARSADDCPSGAHAAGDARQRSPASSRTRASPVGYCRLSGRPAARVTRSSPPRRAGRRSTTTPSRC